MPHALPLRRGVSSAPLAASQAAYQAAYDVPGTSNVIVIGGSYGGMRCAAVLASTLPPTHRVILVERNSHFNHLYVFPRFSVFPSHEHKAFIPYRYLFKDAPARNTAGKRRRAGEEVGRKSSSGSGSGSDASASTFASSSSSTAPSSVATKGDVVPDIEAEIGAEVRGKATAARQEGAGREALQVRELGEALDDIYDEAHPRPGAAAGFEGSAPHLVLHATVIDISPTHVTVTPSSDSGAAEATAHRQRLWSIADVRIPYTHLVYALGSHLPTPLRTDARTKQSGTAWLRSMQARIASARSIAIVGGGPLGVQLATDIGSRYAAGPEDRKDVTLLHSRKQLLPNFDPRLHDAALRRLEELGVRTILGERLALTEGCPKGSTMDSAPAPARAASDSLSPSDLSSLAHPDAGPKVLTTTSGRKLSADLVLLCNGQQPNSSLLARLSPSSVDPQTRLVRVRRTLQVALPEVERSEGGAQMPFEPTAPCGDCDCFVDRKVAVGEVGEAHVEHTRCIPNVYAIGDVADAFGALCAGYQAWAMGSLVAESIVSSISAQHTGTAPALPRFEPAPHMIKLTLGLGRSITQGVDDKGGVTVSMGEEGEDLNVEAVWGMATAPTDDLYE